MYNLNSEKAKVTIKASYNNVSEYRITTKRKDNDSTLTELHHSDFIWKFGDFEKIF